MVAAMPARQATRSASALESPCERGLLRGQHDEEGEGEDGEEAQAVGQGADVLAILLPGEAAGLPGVEEVADEEGDGDGREHAAVEELGRELEQPEAKAGDEEQVDEVVEGEGAEAVEVAANEEFHAREAGVMVTEGTELGHGGHGGRAGRRRERRGELFGVARAEAEVAEGVAEGGGEAVGADVELLAEVER